MKFRIETITLLAVTGGAKVFHHTGSSQKLRRSLAEMHLMAGEAGQLAPVKDKSSGRARACQLQNITVVKFLNGMAFQTFRTILKS